MQTARRPRQVHSPGNKPNVVKAGSQWDVEKFNGKRGMNMENQQPPHLLLISPLRASQGGEPGRFCIPLYPPTGAPLLVQGGAGSGRRLRPGGLKVGRVSRSTH